MTEKEFNDLIRKSSGDYQVFFFASKMSFPFSMFLHTWIVVVDHGEIGRYDVWGWKKRCEPSWGYVHLNLYKPWIGVRKFPSKNSDPDVARFPGFVLKQIEGDMGSLAEKIIYFVKNRSQFYPYQNSYKYFPGPNSNTFTQWVIVEFPELDFKLPWGAVGKNFI